MILHSEITPERPHITPKAPNQLSIIIINVCLFMIDYLSLLSCKPLYNRLFIIIIMVIIHPQTGVMA